MRSKSRMLCCSRQKTLMTFWPFISSCTVPSVSARDFCCRAKYLDEPPPRFLTTKVMATIPTQRISVIQMLKYSMIAKTTSTIEPACSSEGSDWLTSWRSVSMSLV